MIYSQYTEFFDLCEQNAGLLVNSLSGAVDMIAGETYTAWKQRGVPVDFEESVRSCMLKRGHFYAGTAQAEHAFFVSVSTALHKSAATSSVNSFWIIPTYRCNLRCTYCFQDHALHDGSNALRPDMTPHEAVALVDLLDDYGGIGARPGKPRYITLFGGEPLMRGVKDTVRALIHRAREKGYKIGAVTNGIDLLHFGDLLGPDLIRWTQITLDGLQGANEKRRSGCSKADFNAIARGIDLALSRGVKISLRTNVDRKLLDELVPMDEWIKDRGWTAYKNFSWYSSPLEAHSNPSLRKIAADTTDLLSHWSQNRTIKARPPYIGKHSATLRTLRHKGIAQRIETSACGAHTGMLFFDPLGNIYACAEQAGKPNLAIGRWRGTTIEHATLPWSQRHVGASPVCSRCTNAFFCGGGCANAAWSETGDFFAPRCNGIKEAIQIASREFAQSLLADEEIAAQLTACGSYCVNEDSAVLSVTCLEEYMAQASCVQH